MKKFGLLLFFAFALKGQELVPSFKGHVVSCTPGYATFQTEWGERILLSSAVNCEYFWRYRNWFVYSTTGGGGHPDHITAIEPAVEQWELHFQEPIKTKQRNWLKRLLKLN